MRILLAIALLSASPAAASPSLDAGESGAAANAPGAGHVAWTHDDNAFFTSAQVVTGTTPSVIVGSGHRNAFYSSCTPGNPSSQINSAQDSSTPPEAKLVALDPATGGLRWHVALSDQAGPASERKRFVFLFQSLLDDLDGDGQEDLLTVTGEYDVSLSSTTPVVVYPRARNGLTRMSVRDPATGALRWERSWAVADGHYDIPEVDPVSVGGKRLAIVVSNMVSLVSGYTIESATRLVSFTPEGSITDVASLPSEPNSLTTAAIATGPAGVTVVLSHVRLDQWTGANHGVDFETYGLVPQAGDGVAFVPRWTQHGVGGMPTGRFPAFITDDAQPKLITAQGNDGRPGMLNGIAAYDLATGTELWRAPVYVGQGLGPLAVGDLNADGVDDAIGGMMGDIAGVPTLPPAPEIVAVDGRTGQIIWRRVDGIGKFRPLHLSTADLDGDGRPQVVATLVQRDGTTCGNAQDEQGVIGVYDGATGAQQCRMPTDRPVWTVASVDGPVGSGQTLVAPALGGTVYGFQDAEPGCGLLAAGP